MPCGAYIYCVQCTAYTTDRGEREDDEAWVEDAWEGKVLWKTGSCEWGERCVLDDIQCGVLWVLSGRMPGSVDGQSTRTEQLYQLAAHAQCAWGWSMSGGHRREGQENL